MALSQAVSPSLSHFSSSPSFSLSFDFHCKFLLISHTQHHSLDFPRCPLSILASPPLCQSFSLSLSLSLSLTHALTHSRTHSLSLSLARSLSLLTQPFLSIRLAANSLLYAGKGELRCGTGDSSSNCGFAEIAARRRSARAAGPQRHRPVGAAAG